MRRVLLVAVLAALLVAPVARAWTWPVGGPVLQPFSFDPAHPYAAGEHRGIDIAADAGRGGARAGCGHGDLQRHRPGLGPRAHDHDRRRARGHADPSRLDPGRRRERRSPRASRSPPSVRAATPRSPAPYLHLGIRVAAQAQGYLDPLSFLPARGCVRPPPAAAPSRPLRPPAPVAAPPAPSCRSGARAGCRSAGRGRARAKPGGGRARPTTARGRGRRRSAAVERRRGLSVRAALGRCGLPPHQGTRRASCVRGPRSPSRRARACRRSRRLRPPRARPVQRLAPPFVCSRVPSRLQFRIQSRWRADARRSPATAPHATAPHAAAPSAGRSARLVRTGSGLCSSPSSRSVPVRSQGARKLARIIGRHGYGRKEDPRGAGVALCVGLPAPGARGGVRAVRRVRALPPAQGQRRAGGERHRRARDAGDGGRRRGREVLP